jgi:hypothetical protein
MKYLLPTIALLILSTSIQAKTEEDYQKMGTLTWVSWSCYFYALDTEDKEAAAKFFKFGYDNGKEYLANIQNGNITTSGKVPIGIITRLSSQTHEFILGTIFEAILNDTIRDINKGALFDIEMKKWNVERLYRESNCEHIGAL